MKKIILLTIAILFWYSTQINSHNQHAHQYITNEAYRLLMKTLNIQYPAITNNLGIIIARWEHHHGQKAKSKQVHGGKMLKTLFTDIR